MPVRVSEKDNALIIELVMHDFKESDPKTILEVSAAIRESMERLKLTGYLGDMMDNFADGLSSIVCKVCMGTGQVGGEEKIPCPKCQGKKWHTPK